MTERQQDLHNGREPKRSPIEVILEIKASLDPPLPEPPEGATWVGKKSEEMTDAEQRELWDFAISVQQIIASRADKEPNSDHPRYVEYLIAKQEYESWFRLSPEDLLREFTI